MHFRTKATYTIDDLLEIMKILRSPQGCPWDREQSHQSIRNNFLEESYEAVEAIDTGDRDLLREELGDVLLQVVFHARLEEEAGGFCFADVVDGIAKKLIERHPHVFADTVVENSGQVLQNWEAIKKASHGRTTDAEVLESVSPAMPALMRAQRIQKKAAKTELSGLPFETGGAMENIRAALQSLESAAASNREEQAGEVGNLLFSVARAAGLLNIEAEQALADACGRYIEWFRKNENARKA